MIPYKMYFRDGKAKNVQRGGRTITLVMDAKYTKKKSHKLRCYEYSIDTTAVHR